MALRLIIEDDEGTTTVVPLGADAITIGRQQGNTIQLTEKNVSRRHARLFPEPDEEAWFIEDLGSYNGLKVNGAAIEARTELNEGDVVQIGDYHLTLTENADKTAVSPMPIAANDPAMQPREEPMLASSSTELPRLSADDLNALKSGPVPVQPMADSGAVPAVAASGGYEEESRGGKGMLVVAALLIVGLAVGAFVWMASSGDESPAPAVAAERPKVDETKAMAKAEPPAPPPEPGIVEPAPEPETPVAQPPEPAPEPEIEVVDETPEPSTKPKSRKPKARAPKNNGQSKKTPPPAPAKPAKPDVDVGALIKQARKASLSNSPRECYDAAKKAYDASRDPDAAYMMASCSCRMRDESKAKRAAAKVRGSKKQKIIDLCADKGITL